MSLLAIIDIETTHAHQARAGEVGLVQIATIIVDDHLDIETYRSWRCHPRLGCHVDPEAMAINGYDPRTWDALGAHTEASALDNWRRWLRHVAGGRHLAPVAHGANFEATMLPALCHHHGIAWPLGHSWECTRALFATWRRLAGERCPTSLAELATRCGHWSDADEIAKHHDALEDCRATLAGLRWLQAQLCPQGLTV